jgi:hypothetical protein
VPHPAYLDLITSSKFNAWRTDEEITEEGTSSNFSPLQGLHVPAGGDRKHVADINYRNARRPSAAQMGQPQSTSVFPYE